MPDNTLSKSNYYTLLVPLCTLVIHALLFMFRGVDDNRLTSWKWVFADADIMSFMLIFTAGLIAAYVLSKLSYAERMPALFLFVSSFAVSAVFWKEPEVIVDASRYFTQAKHLEVYGIIHFMREWGRDIGAWTDLPLVPLMYGLIFRVFGESREYIQIFTGFLFSMTVVTTYLTGKTLWDRNTGFCAGVLLLGIPYIFSQIPLMLVDVPTMFFLTFSIYSFIKAMEKGGIWNWISSISVFCAAFSKYSTWMMLSVLPVIFLVYVVKRHRTSNVELRTANSSRRSTHNGITVRFLFIGLMSGLLIGIILFLKFDVIAGQIDFLREYQAPGLRRWGEGFVSTFFYQIHPFITIAALCSFYEAIRKKDFKFLIISWLILLVIVFQIKRSRYVMVAFPMLTLMASYGLQRIRAGEFRRAIVYCAVAASIVTAFLGYLPFLQTMSLTNLKDAGEYINSLDVEKVEVFTIPSEKSIVNQAVAVPILDLHTEKEICYHYDTDFTLSYEKIEKSPLRFTWEYENPDYYCSGDVTMNKNMALVVISNRSDKRVPDNIKKKVAGQGKAKVFSTSTGIFRYSPVVTVHRPFI